jgi:hypothetical protein
MPEKLSRLTCLSWAIACVLLVAAPLAAQDTKPRIGMAVPLAAPLGATTKVKLRGWNIDGTREVRSSSDKVAVKILNQGGAPIPNQQDAKQIGDKQIEIELTVDADAPAGDITLTATTPLGEAVYTFAIGAPHPLVAEKEGNDSFRGAQPIALPHVIDGLIQGDRDVDVFMIELTQPQRVVVDVIAGRRGSGFDSLATLFDARGNIVAQSDDTSGTTDSHMEQSLTSGKYYITLQDAHDRGGEAHPYRLIVTP